MVKLNKIVVQGFKSFRRKSAIPIQPGFSVFTGPNGSGKTNVADAILFVLGKIPAKSLRAAKASNLIFQDGKKNSAEYAMVGLHFDNSSRKLPFEENDVSISRRINSKGVSTYKINGRVVTRQELIDTLLLIGLHPDAHNIIQQGDVNMFVEMNAEQRRHILDDISGIAEYDDKKRKAEAELAKTEEKLKEAEIIIREKTAVVERLQKEREGALLYKSLTDELGNMRMAMLWKENADVEARLGTISKQIAAKEKESSDLEAEINGLDRKLMEQESALQDFATRVVRTSEEVEVEKKLARIEAEVERLRDKIEANKREMLRVDAMSERIRFSDASQAVKSVLGMKGVFGVVSDLVKVKGEYSVAAEVAAGRHLHDVVVDSMHTAVACINHLKRNQIGRAVFLPLDKMQPVQKQALPPGAIGWLNELVEYDSRYSRAMDFIFGRTACVRSIEKAREIAERLRVRLVTLDGDLIETSGAMMGGHYQKRNTSRELEEFSAEKGKLRDENLALANRIAELEGEAAGLEKLRKKTKVSNADIERGKIDSRLKEIREKRRLAYENRLTLQQTIGRLSIERAKLEARFDNLKAQAGGKGFDPKDYSGMSMAAMKEKEKSILAQLQQLGNINLKALDDFDSIKQEFDEFRAKLDKIVSERNAILDTMKKVEERRLSVFMHTLNNVDAHFKEIYRDLTGGKGELRLVEENNLDSGLLVKASPGGKNLLSMDSMSGGEKTLTAFGFMMAVQSFKPLPFYILDEADATLDKKNSKRVAEMLQKHSKKTQFIVISHNDEVIRYADQVYGVSMDNGESKIFGIKLPEN
ncbi:MAG: AAA family ATPase [Candidatus Aenigmarchaeota archaeon]|nr:AAA family ATPase [Candidatus Aenigmarchaeota archaeon]